MKHTVPHTLDAELAQSAVRQALESYAERFAEYSPQVHWTRNDQASIRFSVKGMTLSGMVVLKPRGIEMDLDVPFVLRVFKKKAITVIEREIRLWLDKAERGELDQS